MPHFSTAVLGPARGTPRVGLGLRLAWLCMGLLVVCTVAVSVGSVAIAPVDVWGVVGARLGLPVGTVEGGVATIVWEVRVPRVLLAAVAGAGLALVGVALQATVRNPIADPYVLGLSSGASVGAVAVIAFGAGSALGSWALSGGAYVGALAAAMVVMTLGLRGAVTPLRILLTGTAVTYAASALASFLLYRAPNADAVRTVVFWLLGSLAGASWERLLPVVVAVTVGSCSLLIGARSLDALAVGDDTAAALGIDVVGFRRRMVLVTSLVTAGIVAACGAIGFVGLLVPHLGRFLVGHRHLVLLPTVAVLGAIFLVLVDLVARTVASPQEIPVGVITAGLGAPFFLWVLHRRHPEGGR